MAIADPGRIHAKETAIAKAAGGDLRNRLRHAVDQADMDAPDRCEIAFISEIRPLADIESADRFRHQPVQIGITLAMRMSAHVDRHVVDGKRQIGAVVEIIAAQEILVSFALARMLRDDQAWYCLQYF